MNTCMHDRRQVRDLLSGLNQVLVERATSNYNREVVGSNPTRATNSQIAR